MRAKKDNKVMSLRSYSCLF